MILQWNLDLFQAISDHTMKLFKQILIITWEARTFDEANICAMSSLFVRHFIIFFSDRKFNVYILFAVVCHQYNVEDVPVLKRKIKAV